jgi:putative transposase
MELMEYPKRKSNRIKDYDYSSNGVYFVTICTKDRRNLFWNVGAACSRQHAISLSLIGLSVDEEIKGISGIYHNVFIDKYIVMPNHVHMIIVIDCADNSGRLKDAPTISRIVQQFKRAMSKKTGFSLWQKSFHDHIIRNEQDYLEIWDYIDTNPAKWAEDKYSI